MTYLILDTSTDVCLIALVKEGKIHTERVFPHLNLLSKNLLPCIQDLMQEAETPLSSLSFIAAGIGPGSYTGTRLGAAVAKSLAFALNIGVKPFSSPLAFLPDEPGSFLFLIPTRPGPYFALQGEQSTERVAEHSAALVNEETLDVSSIDYIISPSGQIPENLKVKPHFTASPNLQSLLKCLPQLTSVPPEHIKIQYFHTPF